MTADQSIQAACKMRSALCRMACKYPYHAEWLSFDRWEEEPRVKTMAVTARGGSVRFHFAPAFVCQCTPEALQAVIHHELNHVVFRHPFTDPKDYPNRHARLIAEEVTVNEYVPEPLPGNPLTLNDFSELPPGEDTHTRYHRLAKRRDLAERVRLFDLHALWEENELSGEAWAADMTAIQRALARQPDGGGRGSERLWRALHDTLVLSAGSAVVESLRAANTPITPLDWRRILAGMAGVRVRREASFARPPRRLPHLVGVFPGCSCRMDIPRAMVAIDTSSSMKRPHFERVKAELNRLVELTQVTVVQCDTVIRKTYRLHGSLEQITGRGGTDLRPPFAPAVIENIRPALIIYFTDGEGPAPKYAPNVPVIWCLTALARRPAAWGNVVHMSAKSPKEKDTGFH